MIKHNQDGAVNGLVVSLVLTFLLLIGAAVFGFWAYSGRQDYKDHSDAKAAAAAKVATDKESAAKDKQFAEDIKQPLTSYQGPEALGSVVIKYPKTWSVYNNAGNTNNGPALDLYFNPVMVSTVGNRNSLYALHAQVVSSAYADVVKGYNNQIQSHYAVASAFALPKLPQVIGMRITGKTNDGVPTTVVLLPIRSQTLKLETFTDQYLSDFNNNILPNVSLSP